ncbi:MAG: dTMP kinase [Bacteroidetes bacterium]|jgi:dTMP kinase|nr:dTMP kinase [Bacteroidota bacterium]
MLLTFEGIDGSGKSTQARLLVERLQAEGHRTLLVREPGGTDLSERLRTVLLDPDLRIDPMPELLLFSAARAQLVIERVQPALEEGRIVICDRFYDSTMAYQGAGRQVADAAWLRAFNQRVVQELVPDRTYLIDVDPVTAAARRSETGAPPADRMETSSDDFYTRVTDAYRALAAEESERFVRLDGARAVEAIHTRIWDDVQHLGLPTPPDRNLP